MIETPAFFFDCLDRVCHLRHVDDHRVDSMAVRASFSRSQPHLIIRHLTPFACSGSCGSAGHRTSAVICMDGVRQPLSTYVVALDGFEVPDPSSVERR
ncbi:hypothetical protein ABT213_29650 [Streptomyces sp. NPDC001674]|uniref:hypothetical protein n=1 Tax=Streptomyces sp. NPDC001674 TaxID=3154394 RepID=UPI0033217D35